MSCDYPDWYKCPLTGEPFGNPSCLPDGTAFERLIIEKYLSITKPIFRFEGETYPEPENPDGSYTHEQLRQIRNVPLIQPMTGNALKTRRTTTDALLVEAARRSIPNFVRPSYNVSDHLPRDMPKLNARIEAIIERVRQGHVPGIIVDETQVAAWINARDLAGESADSIFNALALDEVRFLKEEVTNRIDSKKI